MSCVDGWLSLWPGWRIRESNGKKRTTVGLRDLEVGGAGWGALSNVSVSSLLSRGRERGVAAARSLITSSNNKCPNRNGRKTDGGRGRERSISFQFRTHYLK